MTVHWTKFVQWGSQLSIMASSLHMLAQNQHVGVTIRRQWIKELRQLANEMELHIKEGEDHGTATTTTG